MNRRKFYTTSFIETQIQENATETTGILHLRALNTDFTLESVNNQSLQKFKVNNNFRLAQNTP